jgi:hypothetical protein
MILEEKEMENKLLLLTPDLQRLSQDKKITITGSVKEGTLKLESESFGCRLMLPNTHLGNETAIMLYYKPIDEKITFHYDENDIKYLIKTLTANDTLSKNYIYLPQFKEYRVSLIKSVIYLSELEVGELVSIFNTVFNHLPSDMKEEIYKV